MVVRLVLAEVLRRRRDVVEAELPLGERTGSVVGGEGKQAAQKGRRSGDLELLAVRQAGDVVSDDVGARLVHRARIGGHQSVPGRHGRLGGRDRGLRVRVAARGGQALHTGPGLVQDLAPVGGEGLSGFVQAVLPAQHVREDLGAGAAGGGRGGRQDVPQVVAERLERRDGSGRRRVQRAVAPHRPRERPRRVAHEVDEAFGVVDAILDRGRGQAGFERFARLGEQRRHGPEPAGERGHALLRRAQLAHQQREHAGDDLERGAGMPLGRPAQLQQPQPAAHHLQRRERVHRGAGVVRREQRRERALVRVERLHAPLARRRAPLRQPAGALRQAEGGTQHGVVGDEIVQQTLHRRRDMLLLGVSPPLARSSHLALASARCAVRPYPRPAGPGAIDARAPEGG